MTAIPVTITVDAITQSEANQQGMPAIETVLYSGGGTPPGPVTHGTGNITLRVAATPADYWQSRENMGSSAATVSVPAGYTITGSTSIAAGQTALFVKAAGLLQFRRKG